MLAVGGHPSSAIMSVLSYNCFKNKCSVLSLNSALGIVCTPACYKISEELANGFIIAVNREQQCKHFRSSRMSVSGCQLPKLSTNRSCPIASKNVTGENDIPQQFWLPLPHQVNVLSTRAKQPPPLRPLLFCTTR